MIPIAKPLLGKEEEKAVLEILRGGELSQGKIVEKFEEEFAAYCGTKYAIATGNGTSALMVALVAAGIGGGDEVITTPFTFIASATSIIYAGAKPVFADIDPATFNLNPELIEAAITKKTRAILPVHLYGLMTDMRAINKIAEKYNLMVIEDAAQAHGAEITGKKAGSWGLSGILSFYPTKNMTTGEGGMITTNSKVFAEKCRLIRNQGMKKRYYHESIGYNFRMTNIAAAIGREQLKKLKSFTKKRIENANFLTAKLKSVKGIVTPTVPKGYKHVFHQYTIRCQRSDVRDQRAELIKKLEKAEIGYGIYYPVPVHKQKALKNFKIEQKFPESEKASLEVISLPVHPNLTKKNLEYIVSAIKG